MSVAEKSNDYPSPRPHQGQDNLLDRLDPGIRETVRIFQEYGIETTESCEGTRGHCYPEPTVCFNGGQAAGYRAVQISIENGLRPSELRRVWKVENGELVGPEWHMTFHHTNGGGIHPVQDDQGEYIYKWGPISDTD